MRVRVHDIHIHERIRSDMGDITALMDSMQRYGLLNPIVINHDNDLIAGHRRLESARRLGWDTIEACIVSGEDEIIKLELEIEENVQRKDLSQDELADAYLRLEKLKNPGWWRRFWQKLKRIIAKWFGKRSS